MVGNPAWVERIKLPSQRGAYGRILPAASVNKVVIMNLRTILLQEALRAIAGGWVLFLLLALFYQTGALNLSLVYIDTGIGIVLIFLGLTIIRLRTGHDLMARTLRDWVIVGAVMLAMIVLFVIFQGFSLQAIIGFLLIPLAVWLGYWISQRKRA
jgi:hypothetical protein